MKNIKNFNYFKESLSKSELSDFDLEDISISLSDWWISVEDNLPEEMIPVLIYKNDNKVEIAHIYFGISKSEREELKETDSQRYKTYTFGDEHDNNKKPYRWKNGPMSYFGQEVLYWMPLPAKPEK